MVLSAHICRRHSGSIRAIQTENNRDASDRHEFLLSDIDWDRTPDNEYLVRSDNWLADIKSELAEHGIDGYRKNAVLLLDTIYSASADFFEISDSKTISAFFNDCLHFHESEFGHVINAVIHYDETTPHMHIVSVPIVMRENGFALCARELIPGKQKLYAFHDHLYQEVGIKYDLERGKRSDSFSKAKHLDMYRYKLFCLEEKIANATNDLEKLHADIEKAGSVKELFSWAMDISTRIDLIISSLGGCSIDGLQASIEARGILLENNIISTGFHIQAIDDDKYCCITDSSNKPVSWDDKVPLYIQDGARLIPSSWVLDNGKLNSWIHSDINKENRDLVEDSPVSKLGQIADELESLIDCICMDNDEVVPDSNDVDFEKDDED